MTGDKTTLEQKTGIYKVEYSGDGWMYEKICDTNQVELLLELLRLKQEQCDLPRSGLTNEGYVYKEVADILERVLDENQETNLEDRVGSLREIVEDLDGSY